MASPNSKSKVIQDRENQCRFCLKPSRSRVNITKVMKKKFLELTQTELQTCDKLSNFLCARCSKTFKNACIYRQKLIETQKDLLKEVSFTFMPEMIHVKQEVIEDHGPVTEEHLSEDFVTEDGGSNEAFVKEEFDEVKDDFSDYGIDNLPFTDSIECEQEIKTEYPKVKTFKCDFEGCGEVFEKKRMFNNHKKTHVTEKNVKKKVKQKLKPAICSYCGSSLCSKASLDKHIAAVHLKSQNYFCDICGYVAAIRCLIRSHMKTHLDSSERRKYKCELCEFESMSPNTLKHHIAFDHKGAKPSIPCHCGKLFKHKQALQAHINVVHLKLKNHECQCGRKFYSKKDLNDHKKLAHSTNPTYEYECEKCGKQFYTRKQLMRHIPYHTDIKFSCTFVGCDKSYITEKKLARHMKTHVGERDLLCHLCDKAYFFTKDLQRHLDVAHKQTTYFCEICSFTNNRKDYLSNHIRSAHQHISQEERNKMVSRAKFIRNSV